MLTISVRLRHIVALVALCTASLLGTLHPSAMAAVQTPVAPAAEGDVPMYLVDASRSGSMPGPGFSGRPQLNWRFESASPLQVTPAIVGGSAYFGDGILGGGGFRAVDTASGREQWVAELPG